MKLKFINEYRSIDESISQFLEPLSLGRFTILTGTNGSGKTHLLDAIIEGNIQLMSKEGRILPTTYFDLDSIKISNKESSNNKIKKSNFNLYKEYVPYFNQIEGITLRTTYSGIGAWQQDFKFNTLFAILCDVTNENITSDSIRHKIKNDKYIFNSSGYDKNEFLTQEKQLDTLNYFLNTIKTLPSRLIKILKNFHNIAELPEWGRGTYQEVVLGQSFLKHSKNYYDKLKEVSLSLGITNDKLSNDSNRLFQKKVIDHFEKQNGKNPLIVLNDLLQEVNINEYHIKCDDELFTFSGTSFPSVVNGNIVIDIAHLSSGEKLLFSFAVIVNKFLLKIPMDDMRGVLLLDEIDANLHPSMIQKFLDMIKIILKKNENLSIILVTHSPTTIGLSKEASYFIMHQNKENRIREVEKSKAIETLSEGYITLERGLKLFDTISKKQISIITEGNNTIHIEKAIKVLNPKLLDKLEIIKEMEAISGKNQLKTLFDFFSKVNHDRKVIFVWDCDVNIRFPSHIETSNTIPFIFEKNQTNMIAEKGIENLYPQDIFSKDLLKITQDGDGRNSKKFFNYEKKKEFLKKVKNSSETSLFENFQPLIDLIENELKNGKIETSSL